MKKITNIETLKEFEAHELVKSNEKIVVWNVLTKEVYQSLKRGVKNSDLKYQKVVAAQLEKMKEQRKANPVGSLLDKMEKAAIKPVVHEKTFYTKRITERNVYPTDFLLEADILPEELLREIHLKDIDSFILIRSNDIYVGVLSKRVGNSFLSMVNSLNGSSPFGGGNELPQAGMSIFPILGGGNGW